MDFGAVRALVLDTNLWVHGVDVTVTRPAPLNTPIATRGVWLLPLTEERAYGTDFQRREPRRVLALPRDEVSANVPRGTLIEAPEKGGDAPRSWQVDGIDRLEPDHIRVILVPA